MTNKLKIHLLVNETAGNGHAKKILDQTTLLLVNENIAFDVYKSSFAGEAIKIAQGYGNRNHHSNEVLLVIGGDGSLNEVLNGIKRSSHPSTPLAYLPAGTGNDFGKAANLSGNPEELINHLKNGIEPERIDCGSFHFPHSSNDVYYFANSLGVGFDAYVNHLSNISELKKLLNKINEGKMIYGLHILSALRKQDTFTVDIKCDNKRYHYDDAFLITTTNHPYLGGGIPLLPSASIKSRVLDTVVVERFSLGKLIKLFVNLLKDGSHVHDPQFHYFEGKQISIQTTKKEFAQVDGEQIKPDSFKIDFKVSHFYLLR